MTPPKRADDTSTTHRLTKLNPFNSVRVSELYDLFRERVKLVSERRPKLRVLELGLARPSQSCVFLTATARPAMFRKQELKRFNRLAPSKRKSKNVQRSTIADFTTTVRSGSQLEVDRL
jgi:hypothetical protein